jgi:transcriptional regulator with GAF, ATPase, and Fis domain
MTAPVADYTADLHDLTALIAGRGSTEEVLERALDALQAVVPYDLAAVFRLEGQRLRAVAATGPLAVRNIAGHALDLRRFATLRRAMELRRPVALTEDHHAGEGDPFDGVLDLPHGHACMVVPLFSGERSLGIITLDARACRVYPPEQVAIAGVYGQLVSLALVLAEQAALLDRQRHQLKEQNRLLVEEIGGADVACSRLLATRSARMREVVRIAEQVARTDLPVLVLGETGTGKEVVAQAIHAWSPRADAPFVKLNCSAIPENLVESELFGHVKGAFSGADRERRGRFLVANGGTILLDEIGDMPLAAQAKLLRVLQEGTFEPVGSDRPVKVDVRVVAATHVDLARAVAERRFREDLYYRLAVFPLSLPPLRERPEDVVPIALEVLEGLARAGRRGPWRLPDGTRAAMEAARWPGNVRELRNALERATVLVAAGEIAAGHLGIGHAVGARQVGVGHAGVGHAAGGHAEASGVTAPGDGVKANHVTTFVENERRYFEEVLARTGGRLQGPGGAAAITGLKPTTLRSRLMKLGLR